MLYFSLNNLGVIKMFLKIISFSLIVLITSCSAQKSDDVFQNLENNYPPSKYLSAIGEGDSRKDAEKNAMGKLALIFESKINTSQTLNEHYSEFSDEDGSSLTYEASTKKKTNVSSDQKLLNVKYGKHQVDEVGNNMIVAYIDRRETAVIYDEKIESLNSSILSLGNLANKVELKIKKYAALNRASQLMNENLELMKQQSIISPYNPDFSDKVAKYDAIYRKKGEVANSVKFVISGSDEDIVNSLSSIITSKGFKIVDSGDFLISGTLKYEEVDLGRKEIFYNWHMNIQLLNVFAEIIFNFDKSGREGGITESAVYSRAKFEANKSLKKEFTTGFDKYLDSLLGM